jgi:predicted nucleotide-binding protein with TIR-like domain/nucleotide-binding STING sensor domain-containing protein
MEVVHVISVFIMCSTEGLTVARAVQANLTGPDRRIEIWDEAEKHQNEWLLGSLLNSASFYDFGIAILTPDDVQRARQPAPFSLRGRRQRAPRDNVIFEAGLFLGRLGVGHSFVVLHKEAKLPTDLAGTIVAPFDGKDLSDYDDLLVQTRRACKQLDAELARPVERALFSLLPSTGLAVGYYHNFIAPVFDAFGTGEDFSIEDREGNPVPPEELGSGVVTNDDGIPDLFVWLPSRLELLRNESIKVFAGMRKRIRVKAPRRSFDFYLDSAPESGGTGTATKLVDVPTTLLASLHAMQGIPGDAVGVFSDDFLDDRRRSIIERRETENFRFTVERLAQRNLSWARNLQFEYFDIENGVIGTRLEL